MLPPDVWRSAMPAGGCREWLSALGLTGTSSVITGAVVAAIEGTGGWESPAQVVTQ